MAENQKYILMIDGAPVEVNREIYIEYHRMDRRDRYLEERDLAHGKTLYSNLDTVELLGEEMIPDSNAVNPEDAAIACILHEKLHQCLDLLSEGDRQLIDALYFQDKSERDYAKKVGISQKGVNKRRHAALAKLKIFMKDLR